MPHAAVGRRSKIFDFATETMLILSRFSRHVIHRAVAFSLG
jgi:hypothetical protein